MAKRQVFKVTGKPVGFKRPERTRWGGRMNPVEYEAYKERIILEAKAAGIENVGRAPGGKQDIDNVLKAFMDALQHGLAYNNDNMVGAAHIRRVGPDGKQVGNVTLRVDWLRHKGMKDRDKDEITVTIIDEGQNEGQNEGHAEGKK